MKKFAIKLAAAAMSLILAVTVVVMSSYAWLTLSDSPEVNGIYIAVGGGNTILIAADLTQEKDGVIYHYPDEFSDTLNFSQHSGYDYLKQLGGMTPVSTADGLNWYLPSYYEKNDPAVVNGTAVNGQIRPFSDFLLDDALTYANLTNMQSDMIDKGSYVYLDFWVVSPGADYQLHVSTGDDTTGSFAIGLPDVQEMSTSKDGRADGYRLVSGSESAAASVRIGFLTNQDLVTDQSQWYYMASEGYSDIYTQLRGVFPEPGAVNDGGQWRFMIYEPNGTLHPDSEVAEDGSYVVTTPLMRTENGAVPADIRQYLAVQGENTWLLADNGYETMLNQVFQTSLAGQGFRSTVLKEMVDDFYNGYLQGQLAPYVDKADFVTRTGNLYALANNKTASANLMEQMMSDPENGFVSGATDDAYIINLKRNVPQRIRMFIWLEGQDVDCTNDASASSLAINLELAGSSN